MSLKKKMIPAFQLEVSMELGKISHCTAKKLNTFPEGNIFQVRKVSLSSNPELTVCF